MVSQKYDPFHSGPFQSCWRSSGNSRKRTFPEIPFRYLTIAVTDKPGGADTKQCTWSASPTLQAETANPFSSAIFCTSSYSLPHIGSVNTFLR